MKSKLRIAAAIAATALAAPALATDPMQPEVTSPAPAVALHASGRAEAEAVNADPTQPRTEIAAPAVALRGYRDEAGAGAILNDEPMASAVREPTTPPQVAAK